MGFSAFALFTAATAQYNATMTANRAQDQAGRNQAQLQQTLTDINKPTDEQESTAANRARKRTVGGSGASAQVLTGPGGLGELPGRNREVKTLLGY